ncbi:MAG TPA: sulfatase-like hydrolase/transferase, partial [Polyangia bacterium]|nr:sulfatase-like hydrolase/transferase [Polyangia bacterium]
MRLRDLYGPVAASTFAGFAGAGLVDVLITAARSETPVPLPALLVMAIGLYGAAGLLTAMALGVLSAAVLNASPGGFRSIRDDPGRDRTVAGAILATTIGVLVLAAAAAAGQRLLVGKMASQLLATIAAAGIVALSAPLAAAVTLGLLRGARAIAGAVLPRPRALGATGLLLVVLLAAGVLAAVFALSRADWRVLDLGPLMALALAALLGLAHGIFWYVSRPGKNLAQRIPGAVIAVAAAALAVAAMMAGARIPEASPLYPAITTGSTGLRFGVLLARALTDRDGDGFSARFGGGDCDDADATVYPGAEDVPGDGVDQNCEGGDAPAVAGVNDVGDPRQPTAADAGGADKQPPIKAVAPAAGAFAGNLLVITIDALRADRLGVSGYTRPPGRSLTPALDALAKRGAYFRRVWSQAPNTPRSFPAILTSRYPSDIAWDKPGVNYPIVLPSNRTFFEGLAAVGLRPIGIFSHFYFTPDRGLNKAFVEWSNDGAGTIAESNKDVAAPRIVPRVIERLKKAAARKERFVVWTHLFEPHSSYVAHKEFPTTLSGVPGLMEKYDYEVAFVDRWVGKLLDAVKALGLADNTAVVVMADHGEAWGEHKAYFHGQDLFDEQLRVPLIISVPGKPPRVIDEDV